MGQERPIAAMLQSLFAFFRAALSTALTVTTLTLCMVWMRLAAAPIPLDGYAQAAQRRLSEQLERSAPGWGARLGKLEIAWDSAARRPGARLVDIALTDPSGAVAFQAPSITVGVDWGAALFEGRIEPTGVSVHGAELVFARAADGSWRFNLAAPQLLAGEEEPPRSGDGSTRENSVLDAAGDMLNSGEGRADMAHLIDALTGPQPLFGVLGGLNKIDVVGAGVTYRDDLSGAYLRAEQSRLELRLTEGGGLRLAAQAFLEIEEPIASEGGSAASKDQAARRIARAQQALQDGEAGGSRAKISLVGERLHGAREASLSVRFEDAPLGAITAQFHDLDALQALEGFVSGEAVGALSLDTGDLLKFSAALRGEGAQFAALRRSADALRASAAGAEGASGPDPLALSAFSATFDYAPDQDAVRLKQLKVTGDRLEAELVGDARFLRDDKGAAYGAEGALRIVAATVLDPQLFAAPLTIDGGGFEFTLEGGAPGSAKAPKLWMRNLTLKTPDIAAEGAARVLFAPPIGRAARESVGAALGLRADLDLALSDFELARMPRFWPLPAAPGARDWIAEHVSAGWIRGGKVEARIGGGAGFADAPADREAAEQEDGGQDGHGQAKTPAAPSSERETIDFDFRFENVASSYLDDMTSITGATGVGRVEADRFEAKFHEARADLGDDGVIRLDGSRFSIGSFEPEFPIGEIRVRSDGPLRALLALIDQEPLSLTRKLDLKPQDLEGRAKGVTRLTLPLKKDLPAEQVKIDAEGVLKQLAMPVQELDGARAYVKRATLKVSGERLRLRGETRLEGFEDYPFEADWRERFSPAKDEPSTVLIASKRFEAEALNALGAPEDWDLGGVAKLAVRVERRRGAEPTSSVTVALGDMAVKMPWIGWSKRRGDKGTITADLYRKDGLLALRNLRMASAGLTANGAAEFGADRQLRKVTLDSMKTEAGTDIALTIDIAEDRAVTLTGGGPRLHLKPLAAEAPQSEGRAKGEAKGGEKQASAEAKDSDRRLSLNLQFDRLTFAEGPGLQDVAVAIARSERGGFYADLSGKTAGGFLTGSARPEPEGVTRYKMDTDDLGGFLTAMGVVEEADRGAARIEAIENAEGVVRGRLEGSNVVIKSAPSVADALSVVSVVGIMDLASTGGITFSGIEAPFVYKDEQLTIDQFTAKGPSLGLTAKIQLHTRYKALDVRGQVSPAFVLNGLPGELPVIGRILTGGEGKGIIGFSFAVKGTIDDPKVEVNPLSALTPGPLRGIFGG